MERRGEGVGTHKARSYTTKFSLKRPRNNTTLQQGERELGVIDKLCKHLLYPHDERGEGCSSGSAQNEQC